MEQLPGDLERHDQYPFFDKLRINLAIGKKFPKLIFGAIKECHVCHVGVVVVVEEVFMSKWSMLELHAMVKKFEEPYAKITIVLGF